MSGRVSINAVAQMAGVSRMTVWRALNGYEESKVAGDTLERIRNAMQELQSASTAKEKTASAKVVDKIYWLSPSADYAWGTRNQGKQALEGVIEGCTSRGIKLEITPISRNNSNVILDWKALSHLKQGSRVIVFSHWMNWALLELSSRGCEIVQIAEKTYQYRLLQRISVDWMTLLARTDAGNRMAMQYLWDKGSRRPALAVMRNYMYEPDYQPLVAYNEFLERKGIKYRNIIAYNTMDDLRESIRNAYQENPFDGLSTNLWKFDLTQSAQANLDVPEEMPILFRGAPISPIGTWKLPCLCYDFKNAGHRAVDLLSEPQFKTGVEDLNPKIKIIENV